jgi:dihydrofolate reductase
MESATRRVRYQVAASLDGFITDTKGSPDWIVMDPDIDFNALFAQFDTFLMGRRTYETMPAGSVGGKVVVFSRTLRQEDHPQVVIVNDKVKEVVEDLKREPGKDIWLFGGGELFRSLMEAGVVDSVELAIIPVLLGGGTPMLPTPAPQQKLSLTRHYVYPKSGIVMLEYDVEKKRAREKSRAREVKQEA